MIKKIKRVITRINSLRKSLWCFMAGEAKVSFSQYGEDVLLRGFLEERVNNSDYRGFWVDIGAHDPYRFSNTKLFSDIGWRGLNVDAMPDAIEKFAKYRPNDINVNVGVGDTDGDLDYYIFNDYVVNTFSKAFADEVIKNGGELKGIKKVPVVTLKALLDRYLPKDQYIDFMTIDTEGLDIEILKSNDWGKYKPDYILIELHPRKGGIVGNWSIPCGEVSMYLREKGYRFVGQCFCTTLFAKISN